MFFDFSSLERLVSLGPEITAIAFGGLSAAFGFAFCGSGCGDENCGCGEGDTLVDYEKMEARIDELEEKYEAGDKSVAKDLAEIYLAYGVEKQRDDELEESIEAYDAAIDLFEEILEADKSDESLIPVLGAALLSRAVALNDVGDQEAAIEGYEHAIKILSPAAEKGDGEAKYDIAGIQLNLGTILHEMGEFEKALKILDESFMSFRALEKISELDTRYYMGKVSVELGHLARDMNEPIEKIIDLYNRSMRLFVELIDAGEIKYEHDLANSLVDKCIARFDAGQGEAVLEDLERAIEILQKVSNEGNAEATIDLFDAMTTQGLMLSKLNFNEAALETLDKIIALFSDFSDVDDLGVLDLFASIYDHRAIVLLKLDRNKEALESANEAIKIRENIWNSEELDTDSRIFLSPSLVSSYCGRIMVHNAMGKPDLAKQDSDKATTLIAPLANDLGEDYEELIDQLNDAMKD